MPGRTKSRTQRNGDPEVVEVEVERLGVRPTYGERVRARVWEVGVPILLAFLIDAGDAFTIPGTGPIALPCGLLAGYLFSGYLKVAPTWRVLITCVTGLYWVLPGTTFVPLATVIAAGVQIFDPSKWKEEPFA